MVTTVQDSAMRPQLSPNFPKFFFVKRKDGSPIKGASSFLIHRLIKANVGEVEQAKLLRSGSLLVKTKSAAQNKKMLELKKVGEYELEVQESPTLNSSRGVITCREFADCSLEEVKEILADCGVTSVQRITRWMDGNRVDTMSYIVTFGCPECPEFVKAEFLRLRVRPYVPNPLRCFQCQRFGHTSKNCKIADPVCGRCGKTHEGSACEGSPYCLNCKGNHTVWSRDCPILQRERKIQEIKVVKKVSYQEARQQVIQPSKQSYARVVAVSTATISVGTQTDSLPCLPPLRKVRRAPALPPPPGQTRKPVTNSTQTVPSKQSEPMDVAGTSGDKRSLPPDDSDDSLEMEVSDLEMSQILGQAQRLAKKTKKKKDGGKVGSNAPPRLDT